MHQARRGGLERRTSYSIFLKENSSKNSNTPSGIDDDRVNGRVAENVFAQPKNPGYISFNKQNLEELTYEPERNALAATIR